MKQNPPKNMAEMERKEPQDGHIKHTHPKTKQNVKIQCLRCDHFCYIPQSLKSSLLCTLTEKQQHL